MNIATSDDEAHFFYRYLFLAQVIDSVSKPGNPNVLDVLMNSVSDVFQ